MAYSSLLSEVKNNTSMLEIKKEQESDKVIALAGNPNVGKSTVFNALTGMRQHTGNWPGKTVTNAQGNCSYKGQGYVMVDLPGCYSLMAHSAEEEVARDFICFQNPDAVIVVCDATCLERNLNLVLQTLEITANVVVCINLMDEARKKKIHIDIQSLSDLLGVPVVETTARSNKGLDLLMDTVRDVLDKPTAPPFQPPYPEYLRQSVAELLPGVQKISGGSVNPNWLALKLLEDDNSLISSANGYLKTDIMLAPSIFTVLEPLQAKLKEQGITKRKIKDDIVKTLVTTAEFTCKDVITYENSDYNAKDRKIDKILTSKATGFPIMILALLVVFWLTITASNYPSQLLSEGLFWVEDRLLEFFIWIGTPSFIYELLVHGVYRVVAWVVSVMLPPMGGYKKNH